MAKMRRWTVLEPERCKEVMEKWKGHPWPGFLRADLIRKIVGSWGGDIAMSKKPFNDESRECWHLIMSIFALDELLRAFQKSSGKIAGQRGVAAVLGQSRMNVYNRLRSLGLEKHDLQGEVSLEEVLRKSSLIRSLALEIVQRAQLHPEQSAISSEAISSYPVSSG